MLTVCTGPTAYQSFIVRSMRTVTGVQWVLGSGQSSDLGEIEIIYHSRGHMLLPSCVWYFNLHKAAIKGGLNDQYNSAVYGRDATKNNT